MSTLGAPDTAKVTHFLRFYRNSAWIRETVKIKTIPAPRATGCNQSRHPHSTDGLGGEARFGLMAQTGVRPRQKSRHPAPPARPSPLPAVQS